MEKRVIQLALLALLSRGGDNGHALFDQLPWNAAGESLRLGSLNE